MSKAQIQCPACGGVNRVHVAKVDQARCGRCKTPLTPATPLELDDAGLDELIAHTDKPVLLDL